MTDLEKLQDLLRNLFDLYMPLADRTLIFDNSADNPVLIVDAEADGVRIVDGLRYATIQEQLREKNREGESSAIWSPSCWSLGATSPSSGVSVGCGSATNGTAWTWYFFTGDCAALC